jgi:DnaJ-class molecular chaperone
VRATFVDYYELLEVHPQASSAEIKAAYRACMVRDHVDQNPDDAEAKERMILLTRAKQILLDEHRRRAFDRDRARWQAASQFGAARPRWTSGRAPSGEYEGSPLQVDLRDVSLSRLIVGVGVAAVVTGLGLAARAVADRAGRKRRRRW